MPAPNRPKAITADFTGIEAGKGMRNDHIPEGDYLVQVVDCVQRTKQSDDSVKMLVWALQVVEPAKYAGKQVLNTTVLKQESLWALRSMLIDMLGENAVPQSAVKIPIEKIVASKKRVGITVEDDEYKGKLKSRVIGTFPKSEWEDRAATAGGDDIDEDDEEEEEDEESTKKKATSSDDDEDMDEIDVDDI